MSESAKDTRIERDVIMSELSFPLQGRMVIPSGAIGVVLFAHGSGSSRFSKRNNFVAGVLNQHGVGTLLLDLLSEKESEERSFVFDVQLLADRLIQAKNWLRAQPEASRLPLAYFGASTGAGAALVAAALAPENIYAVVSRGGRPDLAGQYLSRVSAPTLLIVGGSDEAVLELNRTALGALRCEKRLEVVPGATHLFEEPGALEKVAQLAQAWVARHLKNAPRKLVA
jgi:putative phosphoribosyl transferase